jgi:hypothetical protein
MNDAVIEILNELDENLTVIKTLSELGPLLDEGGAQMYWPHAIILFAVIADFSCEVDLQLRNLAAVLRAGQGEDRP